MPRDGEHDGRSEPPRRALFGDAPRLFDAVAKLVHHATWHMRRLEYALPYFERELRSTVHGSGRRSWSIRRGFLSESWVLFDLGRNDWRRYLTDYERSVGTRLINGPAAVLLDDKCLFTRLLRHETDRLPRIYGMLRGGLIVTEGQDPSAGARLSTFLAKRAVRVVVKPVSGGGGKDVSIVACDEAGIFMIDGAPIDADALDRFAASRDGGMVTEFISQHAAVDAIYPHATNTVRILTMIDDDGPFVAAAVARFGTPASAPIDNWIRGGVCAEVDVGTGRLGKAADYPAHRSHMTWLTHHPDTGSPIDGVVLPNWRPAVAELLALAARLPWLKQVGWDIVITDDGYRIIEGNSFSGTNLFQIHRPLLDDPRVRAFYRRHGVFSRRRRQMLDTL